MLGPSPLSPEAPGPRAWVRKVHSHCVLAGRPSRLLASHRLDPTQPPPDRKPGLSLGSSLSAPTSQQQLTLANSLCFVKVTLSTMRLSVTICDIHGLTAGRT